MASILEWVSNVPTAPPGEVISGALSAPDDALLDAYSRAVITAAERVSPSVLSLEVEQPSEGGRARDPRFPQQGRGHGSGFIFTPESRTDRDK